MSTASGVLRSSAGTALAVHIMTNTALTGATYEGRNQLWSTSSP
jgi:hypothetical protein